MKEPMDCKHAHAACTLHTIPPPPNTNEKATDIYKRLLLENRDDLALNVYVAMCYYKLDYYDVSLEILAVYLQAFPDSAVAMNLKVSHCRGEGEEGDGRVGKYAMDIYLDRECKEGGGSREKQTCCLFYCLVSSVSSVH